MPHARIISTEFKSKEDLDVAVIAWRKWYPDNMPVSVSRHIVRTGEKSTMMTTVYENENLLNQAQEIAAQWWELYGHHVYETIDLMGQLLTKWYRWERCIGDVKGSFRWMPLQENPI